MIAPKIKTDQAFMKIVQNEDSLYDESQHKGSFQQRRLSSIGLQPSRLMKKKETQVSRSFQDPHESIEDARIIFLINDMESK